MNSSQRYTLHFSTYEMVREKDRALGALYQATKGGGTSSPTMRRAAQIENILRKDLIEEDDHQPIRAMISELRTMADAGTQSHQISDDGYVSGGSTRCK